MRYTTLALTAVLLIAPLMSTAADTNSRTARLSVHGMVSDACPIILRAAVKKIKGVKRVEASLADHSALVEYDSNLISIEKIQNTIKSSAGFDTTLVN